MRLAFVVLFAVGCAGRHGAPPVPKGCVPDDPGTWDACDGQSLTVHGKAPPIVYAHPMLANPMGDAHLPQSYLEVAGGMQVVVLSKVPFDCAGPMTVTGTLHRIDLGGREGTPESYKGWSISEAEVRCE